jgi:hypothetical protein
VENRTLRGQSSEQVIVLKLLTQLELLGNSLVTIEVGCLKVIQQTAALSNHH